MSTGWYVLEGQKQVGPMPLELLKSMRRRGRVSDSQYVWTQGMPAWVMASEVPVLATVSAPPSAQVATADAATMIDVKAARETQKENAALPKVNPSPAPAGSFERFWMIYVAIAGIVGLVKMVYPYVNSKPRIDRGYIVDQYGIVTNINSDAFYDSPKILRPETDFGYYVEIIDGGGARLCANSGRCYLPHRTAESVPERKNCKFYLDSEMRPGSSFPIYICQSSEDNELRPKRTFTLISESGAPEWKDSEEILLPGAYVSVETLSSPVANGGDNFRTVETRTRFRVE